MSWTRLRRALVWSKVSTTLNGELDIPEPPSAALTTQVAADLTHKFVFICGLHRSGTSPLFRILRDHPEISGFRETNVFEDEGQHLQTVMPTAREYGGFGRFGWCPEAHLTENSQLITRENRERLFEEWSKHWDLAKSCLLEKSPPNLIRGRFLQAMFPNSYFIVITRHPIAVSLATWKWARISLEGLFQHWLHCHRLSEMDRGFLQRVLVVKYEELINNTQTTVDLIYRFLSVCPQPCPSLNRDGNARYFAIWRELSQMRLAVLKNHLVAKYETDFRHYGYSLVDLDATVTQDSMPSQILGLHESALRL